MKRCMLMQNLMDAGMLGGILGHRGGHWILGLVVPPKVAWNCDGQPPLGLWCIGGSVGIMVRKRDRKKR